MAPDSLFVRTLADDLEQVINGPEVAAGRGRRRSRGRGRSGHRPPRLRDRPLHERRRDERQRFQGPARAIAGFDARGGGRRHPARHSPGDGGGHGRHLRDHDVCTSRSTRPCAAAPRPGSCGCCASPDEVADFTDRGRRKMPALMCGADNNYLALTWRQIDTIRKAAEAPARAHAGNRGVRRSERPDAEEPVGADILRGQGQSDQFAPGHLGRQLLSGTGGRFPRGLAPAVQGHRTARVRQPRHQCEQGLRHGRQGHGGKLKPSKLTGHRLLRVVPGRMAARRFLDDDPDVGPVIFGSRGQDPADHQQQSGRHGGGGMVERAGAYTAPQGLLRSLRFQRRSRPNSRWRWSRNPTTGRRITSVSNARCGLFRGRHRGDFHGTGRCRRTDARTMLALAKRLSRMLLLLLGVGAAGLRQRRTRRRTGSARATTGCRGSAPAPMSPTITPTRGF